MGEYIYQSPRTDYERERHKNGVKEFHKFFTDLKSARNDNLEDFEEFIQVKLFI
jgi:hypothetical protein